MGVLLNPTNAQNLMIVSLIIFGESWGTRLISTIFLVGSPGAQASQFSSLV